MTDEEYVFRQTERERKRIGYGARNKKNGSKTKYVSLPSDKLSKKEREAMNGEIVTYPMNKPVKYDVFSKWPAEIRKNYIVNLEEKYGATSAMIAGMMGVTYVTVWRARQRLGLPIDGRNPPQDVTPWHDFLRGEKPVCAQIEEAKAEDTPEAVKPVEDVLKPQEVIEAAVEEHGVPTITLDMACEQKHSKAEEIAALISALAGSGAKLTIEVTL